MNQKLTLNPVADSSDDVVPSDDAVRQALLRMGSGKPRTGGAGGGGGHHGQRRGGEQMQAASASPDARRRRFSQNEHVPVEYVSRDRQAAGRHEPMRPDQGRADAGEPADDRAGALERELERERQARLAAERGLEEAKGALTAARTRIAHLEIDIQEVRAQRQAMLDLAQSAAQQSAAQHSADARAAAAALAASAAEDADDPFAPAMRRGRGRPRRVPSEAATEDAEPEPVKWWSD